MADTRPFGRRPNRLFGFCVRHRFFLDLSVEAADLGVEGGDRGPQVAGDGPDEAGVVVDGGSCLAQAGPPALAELDVAVAADRASWIVTTETLSAASS